MKINGKFAALAGAALLMGSAAFAQATDDYNLPQGFSFYNEIASDLVEAKGSYYNDKNEDETYQVEFAGISEKVGINYSSEKFEFELAPKFAIKDNQQHFGLNGVAGTLTNNGLNNDDLSFAWDGLDWNIRFTPFDIVDFMLKKDAWTAGGYLPIADQHVGGNLAGDGVAVVFKPIDGLRIGIDIPFGFGITSAPNFLDAEYEDKRQWNATLAANNPATNPFDKYRFRMNAGVDYKLLDMVTVGAFVSDMFNRDARGYGLYANAGISFLDFNLGYTYNGDATKVSYLGFNGSEVKIGGHHKANLAVKAAFGDLSVGAEALMNFFKNQSIYDLYAGLSVGYDLLPGKFNLGLKAGVAYDMGNYKSSGSVEAKTQYREQGAADDVVKNYPTKKGSGSTPSSAKVKYEVAAPMVEVCPSITYTTGKNTFGIKTNLQYWLDGEGTYAANFPVSWKYTF